jgi:DNA-binding transcriptional MerR regulator
MTLTVSALAKRIAKRPADEAAIIERIRHWTRERLISPTGKRNPGTGKHRRFDATVLEEVALLNAMADMGLQIGLMRTALILARDAKAEWREKAKRGVKLFLEIDTLPDGKQFAHCHEGIWAEMVNGRFQVAWVNPQAENAIVFDLTQLFSRLQTEKE